MQWTESDKLPEDYDRKDLVAPDYFVLAVAHAIKHKHTVLAQGPFGVYLEVNGIIRMFNMDSQEFIEKLKKTSLWDKV